MGFLTSDLLRTSHGIHATLLLLRTGPSSSPGVRKLVEPLDEELDDCAWSLAQAKGIRRALTTGFREREPNSREGPLVLAETLEGCKSAVDGSEAARDCSERFAPNMEDIPRMMAKNTKGL